MVYTRAGGSYVVARENFGPTVAQVAAVALLIDYTVTVAVQTAAGTDALVSAFPALLSYTSLSAWPSSSLLPTATCAAYAKLAASLPSRLTFSSFAW